jgi:hypothetical protein
MEMAKRNYSIGEIKKSFGLNSDLARAVHPLMTWCAYDKFQAHTWALRLIDANPASGEDAAAALVNYDNMADGARQMYHAKPHEQRRYDAVFVAFSAWKATGELVAA